MLQCKNALVKENWEKLIQKIKQGLQNLDTKLQLIHEISEQLEIWS